MPAEYAQVTALAAKEDRSMASVCRLMLLRGLAENEREQTHSPFQA